MKSSGQISTLPLLNATATGVARGIRVTVMQGVDAGRVFTVEQPRAVVGRCATNEIQLSDPTISQFHLELSPHRQGIRFCDLQSRNGVRVAGVLIERGVAPSGCSFLLGETTLRVELASDYTVSQKEVPSFGRLIGGSLPMRELYARLALLAPRDISVLIEGETGTGKELVVRALHDNSPRRGRPFIVADCSTMRGELAASTLFGHVKGAFTGATERRAGLFEAAHGGTLFLDEVGELSVELQPMLLRALQEHEVVPVGSDNARAVDVRVLAATWKDLRTLVNRERFRSDLYYRLVKASVCIPPLRERRDDIPALIQHFLSRLPAAWLVARELTRDVLDALVSRDYPGNVRELQNIVESLALLADGPTITLADLAAQRDQKQSIPHQEQSRSPATPPMLDSAPPFKDAKQALITNFEREYLARLLILSNNNLSRAAQIAQLERHFLRELLRKHGLYRREETDGAPERASGS